MLAVRQLDRGAGSALDELPRVAWKSTVEVPWQVVPGPAAQSFCPFRATPKHFSLWAAIAAAFSASVKGAAEASVASALDRALARTSEVMAVFADISLLRVAGWPSLGALGLRVPARQRYVGCQRKNDGLADSLAAETHRIRACWQSWMRRQLVRSPNRPTTGMLHSGF